MEVMSKNLEEIKDEGWDEEVFETITKEVKKNSKSHSLNKPFEIRFKVRQPKNILRFIQYKEQIEKEGQNFNNFVMGLVSKSFEEQDKKSLFKNLKNDMFYSFNKAIYARTSPFSAAIINAIDKVRIKQNIIDKKLDLILNIITRDTKTTLQEIQSPTTQILEESEYFKNLYNVFDNDLKNNEENRNKHIAKTFDRLKKFNDFEEREDQEEILGYIDNDED